MSVTLALVAVGGAVGAVLRYLVGLSFARVTTLPLGTLTVNVLGSFAMGVLAVLLVERMRPAAPALVPLVLTGLLGGFTTFSAFSLDTFRLIELGELGPAFAYVLGSVVLSIGALAAGVWLARGLLG